MECGVFAVSHGDTEKKELCRIYKLQEGDSVAKGGSYQGGVSIKNLEDNSVQDGGSRKTMTEREPNQSVAKKF